MSVLSPLPKLKLVKTAAELVYRQGWNATGINQILSEAQVPKGSFYYYFQSKEDLGVAIIQHQAAEFEKIYGKTLLNGDLSARDAIDAYFELCCRDYHRKEWRWGCPVGSFANEVADASSKIALACRETMDRCHLVFEQVIQRGQRENQIRTDRDATLFALQVTSVWQGAVLCMKVSKTDGPLNAARELISDLLFAKN